MPDASAGCSVKAAAEPGPQAPSAATGPGFSLGDLSINPRSTPIGPARRRNDTGLPDRLKAGIESLAGVALDDVRVYRNSPRPRKMGANAYAQGTDIHLASGQERHLPHEAWHVVQQKRRQVRATVQMKGGPAINDDAGLEAEADRMGARAMGRSSETAPDDLDHVHSSRSVVVQRSVVTGYTSAGDHVYYSDYQKGAIDEIKTFPDHAQAKAHDDELLKQDGVLDAALTSEGDPARVATPASYADAHPMNRINVSKQNPHSVAFSWMENKLTKRLNKNQHSDIADQIIPVDDAEKLMRKVHGRRMNKHQIKRYRDDYSSLHDEFNQRLNNKNEPKGEGSAFHLVSRKLLNLHPYAAFAGGKSKGKGERGNAPFGKSVVDRHHMIAKDQDFSDFAELRSKMGHLSDDDGYQSDSDKIHFRKAASSPATGEASSSTTMPPDLDGELAAASSSTTVSSNSKEELAEASSIPAQTVSHGDAFSAHSAEEADLGTDHGEPSSSAAKHGPEKRKFEELNSDDEGALRTGTAPAKAEEDDGPGNAEDEREDRLPE